MEDEFRPLHSKCQAALTRLLELGSVVGHHGDLLALRQVRPRGEVLPLRLLLPHPLLGPLRHPHLGLLQLVLLRLTVSVQDKGIVI